MSRRDESERISALDFHADFEITDLARFTDRRFPYWTCTIKRADSEFQIDNRDGAWHVRIGERIFEPEAVFGGEEGRRIKFTVANKIAPLEVKIATAVGSIPARKVEA